MALLYSEGFVEMKWMGSPERIRELTLSENWLDNQILSSKLEAEKLGSAMKEGPVEYNFSEYLRRFMDLPNEKKESVLKELGWSPYHTITDLKVGDCFVFVNYMPQLQEGTFCLLVELPSYVSDVFWTPLSGEDAGTLYPISEYLDHPVLKGNSYRNRAKK